MKSYIKKYAKYIDYPLLFTYLALTIFGLIMIYSSSMAWSVNYYNDSPDRFYIQQLINLAIAYPVFVVAAIFPYKHFQKKWMMATVLGVIFTGLILVHFIGFAAGGARSWISLGFVNIQPSEVAKVGIIFYLAGVFSNKYRNGSINKLNESIFPPIIILTGVLLLVFLEPDLGSMVIIGAVGLSVMAASGVRLKPFIKLAGMVVAAAAVFIVPMMLFARDLIFTEKRMGRIDAFFNPFTDDVIRIVFISDRIRPAEQHLEQNVRDIFTQFNESLPRIFFQKAV